MTIEAKARIVIVGGSQALKTAQGVSRETKKGGAESKKAAMEAAKAAKQSAADQIRAAKQAASEGERVEKAKLKAVEKAHAQAAKAIGQFARGITQDAKREAAKQAKDEERSLKTRAETRRRWARSLMTGATAGVIAGGVSAVGVARGVAGVDDIQTRVQKANDFRERLIVTTGQAGIGKDERQSIQKSVLDASNASATSPSEVLGGLEVAQEQFNALRDFSKIITEVAVAAKASKTPVDTFVGMLGMAKQAFGLTDKELKEFIPVAVAATAKGAINMNGFAQDFAPTMGLFAEGTGQKGIKGARQFLGVAESLGTGNPRSAEAATMMERFVSELSDVKTVSALKSHGVKVKGKTTQEIVEQMATSKRMQTPEQLQSVFKDVRSRNAAMFLISARNRVASGKDPNAVDISNIENVSAEEGNKTTSDIMKSLDEDGLLAIQRSAISMQEETIIHLKSYNDTIIAVNNMANKLEKSFGTLDLWASSIASSGAVGAGAGVLTNLAMGASGAGAGAAAGAAGAAGAGGVLAAGALTAVAGIAGAALAGYVAGDALNKQFGADEWLAGKLVSLFSDVNEKRDEYNRGITPAASMQPVVSAIRDLHRDVKAQTEALRQRPPPPTNNPARQGR